ncbi:MAG: Alpha-galactosidase A precursor [bacterium ADurb.Bin429]|nr:MAG: Alpha-galactosidase A precursor [bacterium ADurb.Bin429]
MPSRHALAATPPMGWNSYTCYGITVREDEVLANAHFMAEHLASLGWAYIVLDGMWYQDTGPLPHESSWEPEPFSLDSYGRLQPNLHKFPSSVGGAGLRPLTEQIHALGLKFGLHMMRGLPRLAVERNLPIYGTPYTAAEIADRDNSCPWYDGMYGINMAHRGGQAYYDALLALYADWGVDYLKADDCGHLPYQMAEIEGIARAIDRCGHPIVLSLSIGDEHSTLYAAHRKAHAQLWRMGPDLHDDWLQVRETFELLPRWMPHIGDGCWADPDMLPLGMLHLRKWTAADRDPHPTKLTPDEQVTLMTLWSISRSPLMFAGDLPSCDPWTLSLLTNPEVLAVNQYSADNRECFRHHQVRAWTADDPASNARYLALFNLGDELLFDFTVPLDEVGSGLCQVRDLWAREDLGIADAAVSVTLPPHGSCLYRLSAE